MDMAGPRIIPFILTRRNDGRALDVIARRKLRAIAYRAYPRAWRKGSMKLS